MKGQILVASVIVIGLLGLLIATSLLLVSVNTNKGVVIARQQVEALAINNACAERALYTIRQAPSYTGSDSVTINGKTCFFTVTNIGGPNRKIDISAAIGPVVRRAQITLAVGSNNVIAVTLWEDVP